jgi:hypothetical protein
MIKKRFGWFDIYYAEMLLGIAFAIMNACTGSWSVAFVWIRIQLGNIQTGNKRGEQKIQSSC